MFCVWGFHVCACLVWFIETVKEIYVLVYIRVVPGQVYGSRFICSVLLCPGNGGRRGHGNVDLELPRMYDLQLFELKEIRLPFSSFS